jgi:hypothetical protein
MSRQLGWVWFGGEKFDIYCIPSIQTGGNQFGLIKADSNILALKTLGTNPQVSYGWYTSAAVGSTIYCISSQGNQFGIIDTKSNTLTLTTLNAPSQGNYSWLTSAVVGSKIYCIPYLGNQFGIIDTESNTLTLTTLNAPSQGNYSWLTSAVVGSKIYCIPYRNTSQNQFGIIDAELNTLTLTTLNADSELFYSWNTSAVVGSKIYCIPSGPAINSNNAGNQFGIIDTNSNALTLTPLGANSQTIYSWVTSVVVGSKIYCIPYSAKSFFDNEFIDGQNQFGIIDTNSNTLTLTTLGVNSQVNYRWSTSAVIGSKIYCIPSLADAGNQFGIIDTISNTLTLSDLGVNPQVSYQWVSSAAIERPA